MNIDFENNVNMLGKYSMIDKRRIKKAYEFADSAHSGQYRCSGEPYITHPLIVANMAIDMNADADTICGALLHDTIEDCDVTYEDIRKAFGIEVANLVDDVTKMGDFRFPNKKERDLAYIRKVITSITKDVRSIIIKLLDRTHNMSTMQYKPVERQKANAFETLHIYAPIANSIGAYKIKNNLEDLSLQYLDPDTYKRLFDQREDFYATHKALLEEIKGEIKSILDSNYIDNEIKERVKSIYSIYKKVNSGCDFSSIPDLLSLKILLEDIISCYDSIHFIHTKYNPINSGWRDYITRPNINKYRGLHTMVVVRDNVPLQAQIKTHGMDALDDMGLCSYWNTYGHEGYKKMQRDLKRDYPFYKTLSSFNKKYEDAAEFVYHIESELSSEKVFVNNSLGEVVALPYGSTIEDYLFRQDISDEDVEYSTINGIKALPKQMLKDDDFIYIKRKERKLILKNGQ